MVKLSTLHGGSNHYASVLPDMGNQSEGLVSSCGATCVTSTTLTAHVLVLGTSEARAGLTV